MKKKLHQKKRPFFCANEVMTRFHCAISSDLGVRALEYAFTENPQYFGEYRQVTEFTDRFCDGVVSDETLDNRTYDKFLLINDHMSKVRSSFPDEDRKAVYGPLPSRHESLIVDRILLRARAMMYQILGDFSSEEWFQECKNSGGATVGVPFVDTSDERKFLYPMTCTSGVNLLFNQYLAWDDKLSQSIHYMNGTECNFGPRYKIVEGSQAATVPKNSEIKRFICKVPTLNMFFQQGIMQMMYKRMIRWGLDVETLPDKHRELARIASITGRYATVDWSSASDCVSYELARFLIPPSWFWVMDILRSKAILIRGKAIKPNMYATMGDATTFPLETLTFWTLAQAVAATARADRPSRSIFVLPIEDISVFGDDCILPEDVVHQFTGLCETLGFILNTEKTHTGKDAFRESCGGDYLRGSAVRPIRPERPSGNGKGQLEAFIYTVTNLLLQKYMVYFGERDYVYDKELFKLVKDLADQYDLSLKVVPWYFPDDSGLKIGHDPRFGHYGLGIEPIYVDRHGTKSFRYLRYQYRDTKDQSPDLRLAMWLKRPLMSADRSPVKTRPQRKGGGYVAARGISSSWTF